MKRVIIFLADGFEEIEALTVVDVLRRANIQCDMCSLREIYVKGAHNINVECDKIISDVDVENYDGLVLPGGMPGSTNLKNSSEVINLVKEFNKKSKIVSAICAAPIVLGEANIIQEKRVTSYPGFNEELKEGIYCEDVVVEDNNIITSRGPATAIYFALKLVERLVGKDVAYKLREEMMLKIVEEEIKKI
ncbi:DJ-1/PfpI family protein [Clostridium sp. MB40-C1]|uniref:DJ-1 family glyoxalase III n=1 Tax=Clostridium sp. MB40-C1 TaxID=3070996 RepID=UPI0027E12DE5|nr:DJ-1 family glyoxalase III [Clostridium sp. MB40-C1]WMJ79456.1 DJ-1/PfpI family protein [Clostridium sp. MB40-C1]